jgi:GT2 family glycosyltransferase
MMRKEDFKALGGFNEKYFMYYEDVEICYKFKNILGKRNYCLPDIKFLHFTQSSINNKENDDLFIFHLHRGKLLFNENYSFPKKNIIFLMGLLSVVSRIIILPFWGKYKGKKKNKYSQLLKVLKLYFNKNYLQTSKFEYIR